jgi:hypothetical protein
MTKVRVPKEGTMSKSKTMSIITFAILGLAICSLLYLMPWSYIRSERFDAATWKAAEGKECANPVRQRMADYLLWRRQLDGMSRADVIEMLGNPQDSFVVAIGECLVYRTGAQRCFFPIDNEYLHIKLQHGRVAEAFLTSY